MFAEGKTEEGWADWLGDTYRGLQVAITCEGEAGVPATLLQKAKQKRDDLRRAGRNTHAAHDEVWIVFDRDEHPFVAETLQGAIEAGVGVVFSDACFELWPMMHVEDFTRHTHRHALQRRLHELHPPYDHARGAEVRWPKLPPSFPTAFNRAIHLHQRGIDAGDPFGNPSTTAWLLHHRCAKAPEAETLLLDVPEPLRPLLPDKVAQPLRARLRSS